jgi:predicted RNase H-like HicB family nuclease
MALASTRRPLRSVALCVLDPTAHAAAVAAECLLLAGPAVADQLTLARPGRLIAWLWRRVKPADPLRFLDMSALKFNVVFEDAGEGWVYAHVQELPEVHTQGEGLEQARLMVREAIELVLEDRRERGEEIPATGWALVEPVEIAA